MKNFSSLTDEQLVSSYLEGNNVAFETLLKRYESKVFTYIFYSVKDQELANDLFQDVFLRVVTTLKSAGYTPQGKFGAWVTCITHNVMIDHFRQQSTLKCTSKDDIQSDAILNNTSIVSYENKETELTDHALLTRMKALLAHLPETQREVIVMRYYHDMSFKDIAAVTGVSINTALSRMRYGLKTLRRLMKPCCDFSYAYGA